MSLMGVMSQILLPAQAGGRVLAIETMIPNKAIRNLIREDKLHQIYSAMQSGQEASGMQTLNQSLLGLVERRFISPELALEKTSEPEELQELFDKRLNGGRGMPNKTNKPFASKRGA
jgi:twitching motility protein PilT